MQYISWPLEFMPKSWLYKSNFTPQILHKVYIKFWLHNTCVFFSFCEVSTVFSLLIFPIFVFDLTQVQGSRPQSLSDLQSLKVVYLLPWKQAGAPCTILEEYWSHFFSNPIRKRTNSNWFQCLTPNKLQKKNVYLF